jgi:hypothetical protein
MKIFKLAHFQIIKLFTYERYNYNSETTKNGITVVTWLLLPCYSRECRINHHI